jgi:hypothetical protein
MMTTEEAYDFGEKLVSIAAANRLGASQTDPKSYVLTIAGYLNLVLNGKASVSDVSFKTEATEFFPGCHMNGSPAGSLFISNFTFTISF